MLLILGKQNKLICFKTTLCQWPFWWHVADTHVVINKAQALMFKIDCYKRALLLDGLSMYVLYLSWNALCKKRYLLWIKWSQSELSITLIIAENRAILGSLMHCFYQLSSTSQHTMSNLSCILLTSTANTSGNAETFSPQLHPGLFSCWAEQELFGMTMVSEAEKWHGQLESDVSKEFLCTEGLENASYNWGISSSLS